MKENVTKVLNLMNNATIDVPPFSEAKEKIVNCAAAGKNSTQNRLKTVHVGGVNICAG